MKHTKKRGDSKKYHVISSEAAAIAGSVPPSQCRRQLLLLRFNPKEKQIKSKLRTLQIYEDPVNASKNQLPDHTPNKKQKNKKQM